MCTRIYTTREIHFIPQMAIARTHTYRGGQSAVWLTQLAQYIYIYMDERRWKPQQTISHYAMNIIYLYIRWFS